MLNRAHSIFEVKSIDEDKRIITGIASTPSPDRMDDIVEPLGAVIKLPLPLLWMHDSSSPVGNVIEAKATKAGITVTCQFEKVEEPASLKDELDRAWAMVKAKLVRGFSIGFNPIESMDIEGSRWGRRFTKWEMLELSCVTVPANSDCSITSIKSADLALRKSVRPVVRLVAADYAASRPELSGHQPTTRKGAVYLN